MKLKSMMTPPYLFMHEIAVGSHHRKVRQNFHNLQQAAKVTGKVRIKGVTKFLPTIHALYPLHCLRQYRKTLQGVGRTRATAAKRQNS